MTYSPGSPGSSGYPPGSYGAQSPSFAPTPAAEPGPSKLPFYLNIAVVVLGLGAYIAAFGTVFKASAELGPFNLEATSSGGILLTLAAVLASLLAAIGLLPKSKGYTTVVAILAVLGVLAVVEQIVNKPQSVSIGWALWLVLVLVLLQAIAAVLVLLYDTGVLTPPAPKPRYEPRYGQYGGQYGQQYGGPGGYYNPAQPLSGPAGPQGGPQPGARPPYPPQYAGRYQQGPSPAGYGGPGPQNGPGDDPSGPPTPPTGFPSFSPPPAVGSGLHHATNPNLGARQSAPQSDEPASGTSEAPAKPSDSSGSSSSSSSPS